MLVADDIIKKLPLQKVGVPYHFTFRLTNTSQTQHIEVIQIRLGCSPCTDAILDRSIITAGETATLNTTFTPGSAGLNTKQMFISYKLGNVEQPELNLKFQANVVAA